LRILVAGAGAVGGYFGGRLAEKGEDITFLLRPERKSLIDRQGLTIDSIHGNYCAPVKTISREDTDQQYDLIILAAKAYQFPAMLDDIALLVGENTRILPLLNGYAHYEVLINRWGEQVLGGLCFIESTLGTAGEIRQTSPQHRITLGNFKGNGEREQEIAQHLSGANFDFVLSDQIMLEIWTKYTYITCLAGMTSLMRAPLGAIRDDAGGWQIFQRLGAEVTTIAAQAGFPVDSCKDRLLELARTNHAGLKSSMQRDMEKGLPVEADHLHGYLLALAQRQGSNPAAEYPILSTIYANPNI